MDWRQHGPGGGRARRRASRHAAWLVGLVLLLTPSVARAGVNFTIQNSSGIGQAGTLANAQIPQFFGDTGWYDFKADGYGHLTVNGLTAGQQIYFTRDETPGCTAPEGGFPGQAYTVPTPVPAAATITLPASNGPPSDPGVSNSERGLVGLINQARSQNGAPQVQISSVLSQVTDRYGNYLAETGQLSHCAIGSPLSRMIDGGYPIVHYAYYGEVAAIASSAYGAFNLLMSDSPHRSILLDSKSSVVGVGRVGSDFVLDFVSACTTACERAGLTGDYGDPALADGDPNDGKTGDDGSGPGAECAALNGAQFKKCVAKAIKKCKKLHGKKRKRCMKRVRKNASR
jgi:uncharacterized protein YkwD